MINNFYVRKFFLIFRSIGNYFCLLFFLVSCASVHTIRKIEPPKKESNNKIENFKVYFRIEDKTPTAESEIVVQELTNNLIKFFPFLIEAKTDKTIEANSLFFKIKVLKSISEHHNSWRAESTVEILWYETSSFQEIDFLNERSNVSSMSFKTDWLGESSGRDALDESWEETQKKLIASIDSSLYELSNILSRKQTKPVFDSLEIVTEPSGAAIEINDEYIGKSPVTVSVQKKGMFKIVAIPTVGGTCKQSKDIDGDKMPSKIFFQMRLGCKDVDSDVRIRIKSE